MPVFNGGYDYIIDSGFMKLVSIKQLLFCIAQDESVLQELDTYTLLGVTMMLEEAGYEIEQAYDRLDKKLDTAKKRHDELRAALAKYRETNRFGGKSDIDQILRDDERED